MASQISNATLTVTITENITLGGETINSTNTLTVANINEANKRVVTVPTASEVSLVALAAAVAAGTFITGNVKYMRFTNKDDSYAIRCRVKKSGAETFDLKIDPGKSIMLGNSKLYAHATAGAFSAFVDLTSVSFQADTADADLEIFIAST